MLSDLHALDPELYKNLLFLKGRDMRMYGTGTHVTRCCVATALHHVALCLSDYDGDVADLCLTFSVSDDVFGKCVV